jgi:hypothetical protein
VAADEFARFLGECEHEFPEPKTRDLSRPSKRWTAQAFESSSAELRAEGVQPSS